MREFENETFSNFPISISEEEYEKYVDNVNKIIDKIRPYSQNIYVMVNPNDHNDYYKQNPFDLSKEQYDYFWSVKELVS